MAQQTIVPESFINLEVEIVPPEYPEHAFNGTLKGFILDKVYVEFQKIYGTEVALEGSPESLLLGFQQNLHDMTDGSPRLLLPSVISAIHKKLSELGVDYTIMQILEVVKTEVASNYNEVFAEFIQYWVQYETKDFLEKREKTTDEILADYTERGNGRVLNPIDVPVLPEGENPPKSRLRRIFGF